MARYIRPHIIYVHLRTYLLIPMLTLRPMKIRFTPKRDTKEENVDGCEQIIVVNDQALEYRQRSFVQDSFTELLFDPMGTHQTNLAKY